MQEKGKEPSGDRAKEIGDRLDELNRRMGRTQKDPRTAGPRRSGYAQAFRLSSEFISAILVGLAMGYGLDLLLGTKPWAMIVLLFLGFVAGVMNVLRAAQSMSADQAGAESADKDES